MRRMTPKNHQLALVLAELARRIEVWAGGKPAVFSAHAFGQAFPEIWRAVLQKLGVRQGSQLRYIKSGSRGSAYSLGNEVVKFTTDKTEVEAMAKAGPDSQYIVSVKDVFWFPYPGVGHIGAIRQEKLQPASRDWKNFGDLASFYFDRVLTKGTAFQSNAVDQFKDWAVRRMSQRAQGSVVLALETTKVGRTKRQSPLKPSDNIVFRELNPEAPFGDFVSEDVKMPTEEMFEWFRGLCKELESKGIYFHDLNGGNIMKRGGVHVALDLGHSRVDNPPAINDDLIRQFEQVASAIEAAYTCRPNNGFVRVMSSIEDIKNKIFIALNQQEEFAVGSEISDFLHDGLHRRVVLNQELPYEFRQALKDNNIKIGTDIDIEDVIDIASNTELYTIEITKEGFVTTELTDSFAEVLHLDREDVQTLSELDDEEMLGIFAGTGIAYVRSGDIIYDVREAADNERGMPLYRNLSVSLVPDVDSFLEEITNRIDELDVEITFDPSTDNIVWRGPDGFYVAELRPEQLPAEGKELGICVGNPRYRYAERIKQKAIKVFSLRTESGRPKFTIEAVLDEQGNTVKINQVKGKGNRLPASQFEVKVLSDFIKTFGLEQSAVKDLKLAASFESFARMIVSDSAIEALYTGDEWLQLPNLTADDDEADAVAPDALGPRELVGRPNIWKALAKKLSLDATVPLRQIGEGSNGTAYLVSDGTVLKITKDKTEAQAMTKFVGKQSHYVVDVYRVISIGNTLYALSMEKLNPPDPDWKKFFVATEKYFSMEEPVTSETVAAFAAQWQQEMPAEAMVRADGMDDWGDINPGDDVKLDKLNIKQGVKWPGPFDEKKIHWMQGLANELARYDIKFGDMNTGNVMKRGGDHVVIDLGMSRTNSAPQLEKLED
jgi:hypothetical protein